MNIEVIGNFSSQTGAAVYQLHNPENGDIYIGASSVIEKRIKDHLTKIRTGKHENKNVAESFKTASVIDITVLQVDTPELAFEMEKGLINLYKEGSNLLNISQVCHMPMLGRKHSDETKKMISDMHKESASKPDYVNPFQGKSHSDVTKSTISSKSIDRWKDPEYREKAVKALTEANRDPATVERTRESVAELWKDPAYREHQISKRIEVANRPDVKEATIKRAKERMQDPANVEVSRQAAIEQWKDPEFRAMKSEAVSKELTERWKDPEYKDTTSGHLRSRWLDPEYKAKMAENTKLRWEDPAYKAKMSERSRLSWEDPERRAKMTRPVTVNGIYYASIKELCMAFNLSKSQYRYNCLKNNGVFVPPISGDVQ